MAPTDAQAAATTLVYGLLSDSRYAYRPRALDDQLSAEIFRRYFESLDSDKLFFTQADMDALRALSHAARRRDQEPGPEAGLRHLQHLPARASTSASPSRAACWPSPSTSRSKESWAYDREKASWAADQAALNEIWRKYVKNDALRLKLAGRSQEEIRKTLDKRYASSARACTNCAATTCSRTS